MRKQEASKSMQIRRIVAQVLTVVVILALGLFALVALSALRGSPSFDEEQPWRPIVSVATVAVGNQQRYLTSHGSVRPRQVLPLRSSVQGIVAADSPRWSSDDRVDAGQALLQLDAPEQDRALAQAKAEVARLQAEQERLKDQLSSDREVLQVEQALWDLAQRRLREDRTAREQGSISARQLEQQEQQTLQAQRAVLQRQQSISQAQRQLAVLSAQQQAAQATAEEATRLAARLELHAPFDGVVRQAPYALGQMVNPGDMLLEISDAVGREIHFNVDQQRWQAFLGDDPNTTWQQTEVRFELPQQSLRQWHGRLLRQDAVVESGQRLLRIVAQLEEDDKASALARLPDESFGLVRLSVAHHPGIRLPYAAVREGQAWIVDDDDRAQPRDLTGLQRLDADHWWLPAEDSGLTEGERVVLRPSNDLVPGLRVIAHSSDEDQAP